MINRLGHVSNEQNDPEHIVLKNAQGENFQVNHTTHMVWQMLDGQTELETIVQKIGDMAQVEPERLRPVISDIVNGLENVQLAEN